MLVEKGKKKKQKTPLSCKNLKIKLINVKGSNFIVCVCVCGLKYAILQTLAT